ncbi:DUF4199 domain-containing protein [Dyadobacter frigoris]|uniref:DUF4199 domain-containing protein n=1 Tax=Dyadobacter frigoris TaxID=2576211 RepID=A0A4U6D145_9BACT|nr:DUF4199 domain-containing protein [Dyadobacter frigoris]TKT90306.1 DUF4199 domain-containing protein [Dyadobacter frigoris]GLU52542.1 hypothetical protein Dfri01_20030 [Dyadobacter frigoris]
MKRNIIVCGLIAGAIVSIMTVTSTSLCYTSGDFEGSMVVGYVSMILAFSLIYVAVKNFRDKFNGGTVTFGKAFKIGLYISLIASTIYVLVWLVDYYLFVPDFMDKYSAAMIKKVREEGSTLTEINKTVAEMNGYKEMYKNPLFVILLTYTEILPVGLIVSLICALILKRKTVSK